MTRDIKLSLEASDVFELNRWLDEMRQEQWKVSVSSDAYNRRKADALSIEHRIALLEKFVNAIGK